MQEKQVKGYRAHEDEQVRDTLSLIAEMPNQVLKSYFNLILVYAQYGPPEEVEHTEWAHLRTIGELLWAVKDTPEGSGLQPPTASKHT